MAKQRLYLERLVLEERDGSAQFIADRSALAKSSDKDADGVLPGQLVEQHSEHIVLLDTKTDQE
jgi:hypothetical protein